MVNADVVVESGSALIPILGILVGIIIPGFSLCLDLYIEQR